MMDHRAEHTNTVLTPKINGALVNHVYKQGHIGVLTSIFCSSIILIACAHDDAFNTVVPWYLFFLFVSLGRFILIRSYMRQTSHDDKINLWRNAYIIGASLSGLCWGFSASVLFSHATISKQVLIVLVIAGIAAGSVPLLSAILFASIAFLICTLVPFIIQLLIMDNNVFPFLDATVIIYTIYLIAVCIKTHDMIRDSISLQFENDFLLKNLSVANEKLSDAALRDPLTHLGNRSLFESCFIAALNRAKLHGEMVGLLYIDLDNFKEVNDVYGHDTGDKLLIEVVKRLKESVRRDDTISRLGGDEITVVVEKITNSKTISEVADKLCRCLAEPLIIDGYEIITHASIGISVYPENGQDTKTLLKKADTAMYYAKEHGGDRFHFAN